MRLQTRLTLTAATLITAVSLTVGGAATIGAYQHEFDVARAALQTERAQISHATGQELSTALMLTYQQKLTVGLVDGSGALTVVRDGEVSLTSKPSQTVLDRASDVPVSRQSKDGVPYLLQSVKLANNEWIVLQQSMGDAQRRLTSGLRSLILYTAIADLVAVLVVGLLIRRDLRGLRGMIRTARRLAAGGRDEFAVGSGVTEVSELGRALESMVQQLQANEVAMQRFLGDASHELRTPLTVIRGYLEMLARPGRTADAEFAARSISKMSSEVQRMQRLIEDLLLLAELGAAGRPLELGEVNLSVSLESQLELLRDLQPGRSVSSDIAPDAIIEADAGLMDQLLNNLFGNLRRHTGAAVGVEVKLTLDGGDGGPGAHTEAGTCVLTIDDAGSGLSPEAYERGVGYFERFDPSRSRANGGSGLGMSIMAGIVNKHGGEMTVEASHLGGLRSVIRLPLKGSQKNVRSAS
ncbi:MAG: hypothetical protein RJA35_890 [Actinomycetota bacterium]|jgi:signal transduction histidine kinase